MADYYDYNGIRFYNDKIQNLQDNIPFKTIERDSIETLKIQFGKLSKIPMLQLLLGAAMASLGLLAIKFAISFFINGGTAYDVQFLFVLLLPFGSWLINDSQKKGFYLEVSKKSKSEKFTFEGDIDMEQLNSFIQNVTTEYKYVISNNL